MIKKSDNPDWRLQAVAEVAQANSALWVSAGDMMIAVSQFPLKDTPVTFFLPNMTAIFLEYSNNSFCGTKEYFVYKNFERDKNWRIVKDHDNFFNILQQRLSSIIFAFLALETFMNDSIPDDYTFDNTHKQCRTAKSSPNNLDKDYIMEKISVGDKFLFILADIFQLIEIKQDIKDKFYELKDLRDRITHLKPEDKKSSDLSQDTLWKVILSKDLPNYALITKEIIGYFLSGIPIDKQPRWFKLINF